MPQPATDEARFRSWYASQAKRLGLNQDPDDPEHFYDYRAAFRAGATPDAEGHWPSAYKREGHPRMVIDGVNTKTGERVSGPQVGERRQIDGQLGEWDGDGWVPVEDAPKPKQNISNAEAFMRGFVGSEGRQQAETVAGLVQLGAGLASAGREISVPLAKGALTFFRTGSPSQAMRTLMAPIAKQLEKVAARRAAEQEARASLEFAKKANQFNSGTGFPARADIPNVSFSTAREASRAAAPVATEAVKAAAPAVAEGTKAAADSAALNSFARQALGSKAKWGDKVHLLLDEAGKPIKVLTSDQAGAATRAGKPTTWVRLTGVN